MARGRVVLVIAVVIGLLLASPGGLLSADEYNVVEGDTLSEIAERHGVTVDR